MHLGVNVLDSKRILSLEQTAELGMLSFLFSNSASMQYLIVTPAHERLRL